MSNQDRVYGIDLGTTYSCIAYVDGNGKTAIANNSEGQPTTPSVVLFESAGNIVVGKAAKDSAYINADRVVSTVKRVMGDPTWFFSCDGQDHHPQDVSSYILRKLVADAEIITGDKITDVVITCPAYFGVTEKEATRQAGILAGLNVRYVIPEPTAAAIAYGLEATSDQTILVFDLGGGTFDITMITITKEAITVICTGGNHQLGGKNWDEEVANWLAQEFANKLGISSDQLTEDRETWQELLNAAENAKVSLSSREKVQHPFRHSSGRAVAELTREKFDELTAHHLQLTLSLTDELLATAAAKGHATVDKLLLVGGSTYMPQVIDAVKRKYPFEVMQFDPNQAVAKGAALFGFKCQIDDQIKRWIAEETGVDVANVETVAPEMRAKAEAVVAQQLGLSLPGLKKAVGPKVRNVTSKSFGIVVEDTAGLERVANLIVIDAPVPCTISQVFGTAHANQEGVTLRCMENTQRVGPESALELDTSNEVGMAEMVFAHGLPKGSPVEITFVLGEDGLLSVAGRDPTTGAAVDAQFKTQSILSEAEIEAKVSRNLAIRIS